MAQQAPIGPPGNLEDDPQEVGVLGPGDPLPDPGELDKLREAMRGTIAGWLLALLVFVTALPLIGVFAHWASVDDIVKIAPLFFTPILGLFGTVTGFYYGTQQKKG